MVGMSKLARVGVALVVLCAAGVGCSRLGAGGADASNPASLRDAGETLRIRVGRDVTEIYPLPTGIAVRRDVGLVMPDGTRISANVFLPERAPGPVPVVMAFTSYDKDLSPEHYAVYGRGPLFRSIGLDFGDLRVSEATPFEAPDPGYWVPHGYAVVHVDARGTGKSAGRRDPLSPETVADFVEVIGWASRQPWSNGKVGSVGVSYLAIIQWLVAAQRPEGLAAIIPWEGFSDPYRDAAFHGGIPETAFLPWWLSGRGGVPGSDDQPLFRDRLPWPTMLPLPGLFGLGVKMHFGVTPLIDDLPMPRIDLAAIEVPALVCASWSAQGLHSRGAFDAYVNMGSREKWLYTHGGGEWTVSNSEEVLDYQRAFFDRHLKDDGARLAELPRVRLEVRRSADEIAYVRDEPEWPLPGTLYSPFYLDAVAETLSPGAPSHDGVVEYASTGGSGAVFQVTFAEDTEITGHTKLRLWVSTDAGVDMDLFVALRKIGVDGTPVPFQNLLGRSEVLSRGWLRASHRKLDTQRSTPWQPVLAHDEVWSVPVDRAFPVDIEILPSSTLFEAGSRLQLIVQGQDIDPARNLQHKKLFNAGRHRIHSGPNYDSHLLLPMIAIGASPDERCPSPTEGGICP
jgi:predicted acyl esterase